LADVAKPSQGKVPDLVIKPGLHVRGTVLTSDNKPIADGMRVILSSETVWDSQIVRLAAGHFDFTNLPLANTPSARPSRATTRKPRSTAPPLSRSITTSTTSPSRSTQMFLRWTAHTCLQSRVFGTFVIPHLRLTHSVVLMVTWAEVCSTGIMLRSRYCNQSEVCMGYDEDKVDEMVLALLHLTTFKEGTGIRAWKGHD